MLSIQTKNGLLNSLAGQITYLALFTDDEATAEISGGTYERKPITFLSASNGEIVANNLPIIFNVPASTSVKAVGYYGALTGGTQLGFYNVEDESYNGAGNYSLTDVKINLNK